MIVNYLHIYHYLKDYKSFYCSNCRLLTDITLIEFRFRSCRLIKFYCINCIWIKGNNVEYENNIKKLKTIQKIIRKIIMSKRLKD